MNKKFAIAALVLVTLPLFGCGSNELAVRDAVVKLSPVDSNPSVLYFKVQGGPEKVHLMRVASDSVIRAEMHESIKDPASGMMSMVPLGRVEIPAGKIVEFKKGGKHVMLFGVNKVARAMGRLKVEFTFSNSDLRHIIEAPIEPMGNENAEHSGH